MLGTRFQKGLASCTEQKILSKLSMRKLYNSHIYPYLIYCIEVWGISPHTHLKPLLLLQKKLLEL